MQATVMSPQLDELREAIYDYVTQPSGSLSHTLKDPRTRRLLLASYEALKLRSEPAVDGIRVVKGLRVTNWLREVAPELNEVNVRALSSALNKVFESSGLIMRAQPRGMTLYLMPHEPGPAQVLIDRQTHDVRIIHKRQAALRRKLEAGQPEVPAPPVRVTVTKRQAEDVLRSYDPGVLELPEPNPTSVMAYLDKVRSVMIRMASDLVEREATVSAWQEVVDKAASMAWTEDGPGRGEGGTP